MAQTEYREKLESLGWSVKRGGTKRTDVIDERDGTVAGHVTEHWDDHTDAVAQPKTIRLKAKIVEDDR